MSTDNWPEDVALAYCWLEGFCEHRSDLALSKLGQLRRGLEQHYAQQLAEQRKRYDELFVAYSEACADAARGVAVPRSSDALGALEAALEWHRGDKWRAGTPTEAEAWRAQRERLEAAIEALRAGVAPTDKGQR